MLIEIANINRFPFPFQNDDFTNFYMKRTCDIAISNNMTNSEKNRQNTRVIRST